MQPTISSPQRRINKLIEVGVPLVGKDRCSLSQLELGSYSSLRNSPFGPSSQAPMLSHYVRLLSASPDNKKPRIREALLNSGRTRQIIPLRAIVAGSDVVSLRSARTGQLFVAPQLPLQAIVASSNVVSLRSALICLV